MRRDQLEHLLRAASRIADESDVVVFGSQAILGSRTEAELPPEVVASVEADLTFFDDPDDAKSDLVDAMIGELSPFHDAFGVYGQGVSLSTAVLPSGWRDRVIVLDTPGTAPGRGICVEPHDLVLATLVAGREKDLVFAAALLEVSLIQPALLRERLDDLDVTPAVGDRLAAWITWAERH